ncbi:hypothetical protein [Fluviispira multicolorata]|uniref:Uncharacterized protein n=1 Tax=Fluviispira multicolorata TaxID=2654512 RepID=A0A833JBM3_9BACT|nr:hypothetical protein [Fluviispira multicolorata]KAB8029721.1 hypothetical protein GCL57_09250 [Fluviispira multicolorata]
MRCFKFKIKISIYLILISFVASAKENDENSNRFIITNGYFENTFNSNEGMSSFPMSIYETYDWGFRKISLDGNGVGRFFSWFLSALFQVAYLDPTYLNLTYHEFGHATRMRSFGASNVFYYVDGNFTVTANSYFSLVINRASYPSQSAATSGSIPAQNSSTENSLIVTAGGMNNEILLSKNIAEKIYDRGGSVPDFAFYFMNKFGPYSYSKINPNEFQGGDPDKIETYYANLGKNISRTDFQQAYLFSMLASGTFYSLLWGDLKYIGTGEHNISTLEIFNFSLPDFSAFINPRGLSMETMLHYRVNKNISLGLAYETVYKGDSYNQVSPQIRLSSKVNGGLFRKISAKPQLVMGFSNGLDLGGSILCEAEAETVGVFLKYTYYNKNNLYGERNIPFIDKPHEVLGGIYFNMR